MRRDTAIASHHSVASESVNMESDGGVELEALPLNTEHERRTDTPVPLGIRRKPVPVRSSLQTSDSTQPLIDGTSQFTSYPVAQTRVQQINAKVDGGVNVVEAEGTVLVPDNHQMGATRGRENTWLPYSLRMSFLIALALYAFAAAAVCAGLLGYSIRHYGLGTDDGSTSLLFGWRFTPTLLAVLYVLGTSIVLNDIKRTEAYARLSRSTPSGAKWTLCRVPGAWWDAYRDGFNKEQNSGRTNWVLFSAALVYTFGFLLISPLSASLLDSLTVTVGSANSFIQIDAFSHGLLPSNADQAVALRTVAHQLQNLTTSAWINDDYVVLPFAPSSASEVRFGPVVADLPAKWESSTMVFKVQMTCEAMKFTGMSGWVVREPREFFPYGYNTTYIGMSLSDGRGCDFMVGSPTITTYLAGSGSWFVAPKYVNAVFDSYDTKNKLDVVNMTEACYGRDVILAMSAWPVSDVNATSPPPRDSLVGHICDTAFYMANTSVLVSSSESGTSTVIVDEADFQSKRSELPSGFFNKTLFQQTMAASNWSSFFYKTSISTQTPSLGGPLRLLSAKYDFNMKEMIVDPELISKANRLKQRVLGEILLADFTNLPKSSYNQVGGKIFTQEQRIVVNVGVASTLIALLTLSGIILLSIMFMTRLTRRPLNLSKDPSSLAHLATLLIHESSTRKLFCGTEQASTDELVDVLEDSQHQLTKHGLSSIGQARNTDTTKKMSDWRPLAVKRRNGSGLLLYLVALISGIAALWGVYRQSGLGGNQLSYQAHITIRSSTFNIAPYATVPTLLAVLVGLWWGSVEGAFRRIQPYVEMAKGPVFMQYGPKLTYTSTYLVWGALRAFRNKHWILAMLCLGATFTEIFTVSMSALLQGQPGVVQERITLQPQFELRTDPSVLLGPTSGGTNYPVPGNTLNALYSSLQTNWLYGAVLQIVYNASEPAWSKDGWSFIPIKLSSIDNSSSVDKDISTASLRNQRLVLNEALINVTVTTPAIRARLECSPYQGLSNVSSWLTQWDLADSAQWNVSANPSDLKAGYELGFADLQATGPSNQTLPYWNDLMQLVFNSRRILIPFFASQSPVQCCPRAAENTKQPVGIGYWSYQPDGSNKNRFTANFFADRNRTTGTNITTKWIHGFPQSQLYKVSRATNQTKNFATDHLIWKVVPRLTALNCQPIIEFSNANVTVDRSSESVQDFSIIGSPHKIEQDAWNSSYLFVKYLSNPHPPLGAAAFHATSYGVLFEDALMFASDLTALVDVVKVGTTREEPLNDRTFNYRTPGLNMDFMTLAMYTLAGNDLEALLDPDVQARLASTVFGVFFQHFVSSNVTSNGSWAYQPIGTRLNSDLTAVPRPPYPKYDTITATVSRRVQTLEMSVVATSLCLGILIFLVVTASVVYTIDYKHFDRLRHDVDCMADMIRLVSDSPKFLAWAAKQPSSEQKEVRRQETPSRVMGFFDRVKFWKRRPYEPVPRRMQNRHEPRVRLGTHVGTDGKRKWIVEMVE